MFLLVPANPGSPGQRAVKRLLFFCVLYCMHVSCVRFMFVHFMLNMFSFKSCAMVVAGVMVATHPIFAGMSYFVPPLSHILLQSSCPIFSVTPCWVHVIQPGDEMCGILHFYWS